MSIKRRCELLGVSRSGVYCTPKEASQEETEREERIKAHLDFWHTGQCYLGVRRLRDKISKEDGIIVGRKKIKRYMEEMGIYAVYPKPTFMS